MAPTPRRRSTRSPPSCAPAPIPAAASAPLFQEWMMRSCAPLSSRGYPPRRTRDGGLLHAERMCTRSRGFRPGRGRLAFFDAGDIARAAVDPEIIDQLLLRQPPALAVAFDRWSDIRGHDISLFLTIRGSGPPLSIL